jgi:hypothetical protein
MDMNEATPQPNAPAQPEPAQPEPGGREEGVPPIYIDESGEPVISDAFWDDTPPKTPEKTPEASSYYTPEDFAKAFAEGAVDESKLSPDVAAFYRAAVTRAGQVPPASPPLMPPAPPVPPMPPVRAPEPVMTKEKYDRFVEAARSVAAKNYLGIEPKDFDPFDQTHMQAQNMAMQEIRDLAGSIRAERMRAMETERARAAALGQLDAEYSRKDPEFFQNRGAIIARWFEGLNVRDARTAAETIRSGDPARLKAMIDGIHASFRGAGTPGTPAPGSAPPARQAKAPPPVIGASGGGEDAGTQYVDAAKLAGMDDDEKAAWLMNNKFSI